MHNLYTKLSLSVLCVNPRFELVVTFVEGFVFVVAIGSGVFFDSLRVELSKLQHPLRCKISVHQDVKLRPSSHLS